MKTKLFIITSFLLTQIIAQTNNCPDVFKISPELQLKRNKNGFPSSLKILVKYSNGDFLGIFTNSYTEPPYMGFIQFNSNLEITKTNAKEEYTGFTFYEFKTKKYFLVHENNLTKILDFNSIKLDFNDAPVKTLTSGEGKLKYKLNMDSTKALAIYSIDEASNKDLINVKVGFVVIDDNFDVLFKKECNLIGYRQRKVNKIMNYKNDYIPSTPIFQGVLTNDGKVVLLYECFYDDSKELIKNGKTNFYYKTLIFEKNASEPIVSNIYLENYFVDYRNEPKLILNSNNKVSISFMCNKDAEIARPDGFKGNGVSAICHIDLDTHTGKDYNIKDNIIEIPNEVLKQYTTPSSKKYLTDYITLELVVPMPDGSVKFICEEQNDSEKGSVYIMSFAPDNKYEWTKKIPRRISSFSNTSQLIYSGGFNFLINKGNLDLLYRGNTSNFNLPLNQDPKISNREKELQILISRIDSKGNINTSLLMDKESIKYDFIPEPKDFKKTGNCLYYMFDDLNGSRILKTSQYLFTISPK